MHLDTRKIRRFVLLGAILPMAALGAGDPTNVVSSYIDYGNSTNPSEAVVKIPFDFSQSTTLPGHLNFKTWTSPDNQVVRFLDIKQYQNSGASKCMEFIVNVSMMKLWANVGSSSAPTWVFLSENGGSPKARLWIKGSIYDGITYLRTSAKSAQDPSNSGSNYLFIRDRTSTLSTQALCNSGTAGETNDAFMTVINSTATVLRTK